MRSEIGKAAAPEIESPHQIASVQKLATDKAHDRIIVAATERGVGMGDDGSSGLPGRCWLYILELLGEIDPTFQLGSVVDGGNRK